MKFCVKVFRPVSVLAVVGVRLTLPVERANGASATAPGSPGWLCRAAPSEVSLPGWLL